MNMWVGIDFKVDPFDLLPMTLIYQFWISNRFQTKEIKIKLQVYLGLLTDVELL